MLSLNECKQWLENNSARGDCNCTGISIDSRFVKPGDLFIALRGENFDAHDFLDDVVEKGAAALIVEDPSVFARYPYMPALHVLDTKLALVQLATGYRKRFSLPLIGVTGSNGKTTVKEMIASILKEAHDDNQLATRGNLNNEIGVPLTIFRLSDKHKSAVIELGMNHPGEISMLTTVAQPTIALVNNAQREHQEFMKSIEAVAMENGAVLRGLPDDGIAVFPSNDPYTSLWKSYAREKGSRKIVTFGLTEDADVMGHYTANDFGSSVTVKTGQGMFEIDLAAAGEHNVLNALAAVACTLYAGISREAIVAGLNNFIPVSGRMQKNRSKTGTVVIDDTYNANPDSVRAAIDVLAKAQNPGPRILVLGDMGEVGSQGPLFHAEIGKYAKERHIEHVLTLGSIAEATSRDFGSNGKHFHNREELHDYLNSLQLLGGIVLVKGSRFMKMEHTVKHLLA